MFNDTTINIFLGKISRREIFEPLYSVKQLKAREMLSI